MTEKGDETPLHELKRPALRIAVYANRVEVIERPGCTGFLVGSKTKVIPIRSITSVDVNRMTEALTISTADGRRQVFRVGGMGGGAAGVRDAILRAM